jgi:uncharacterized protein YbjT (DUF2867 family)
MKILVVGAGSFWGRPLVDALRAKAQDVSVFTRDPRSYPEDWRMSLSCHWGELHHMHILEEALRGIDRVVACIGAGRSESTADQSEVNGIRHLLEAMNRFSKADLVRLTSPSPLREADWWPMASRRRADLLVDSSRIPHCLVQMGWAPEMLAPLERRGKLWLPHPLSTPARISWHSRRSAVDRLVELTLSESLPQQTQIRGTDIASLVELSTRICIRHPAMERIHLPGRFFHWLSRWGSDFGFAGWRLVHATSPHRLRTSSEFEDSLDGWSPAK